MPSYGQIYGPEIWVLAGSSPINVNLIPPQQNTPVVQNVIAGNIEIFGNPDIGDVPVVVSPTGAEWLPISDYAATGPTGPDWRATGPGRELPDRAPLARRALRATWAQQGP